MSLEEDVATRYPGLRVDLSELREALAERQLSEDSARALDVALMLALAARDPVALEVFESTIVPDISGALIRFDRDPDFVAEALQRVRVKLLVGEPRARISEYRGSGPLAAWIQIVAIREALMMSRADARSTGSPDDNLELATTSDPTLARIRQRYGAAFSVAFREALADLAERERTMLRLCFVEKLGASDIANLYSVHRVTAFRWLKDARAALLERTRVRFSTATDVPSTDIDSVMRDLATSLSVHW